MDKKTQGKLADFIQTILTAVAVFLIVGVLIFSYSIPVAVWSENEELSSSSGSAQTLYGQSSLFQRFINPDCPKIKNILKYNFEAQEYYGLGYTAIVSCDSDIHWFYDR